MIISSVHGSEQHPDRIVKTVEQFASVRPPPDCSNTTRNNNICPSKQSNHKSQRQKYQTTNRSTSLPTRSTNLPKHINNRTIRERHRHFSQSQTSIGPFFNVKFYCHQYPLEVDDHLQKSVKANDDSFPMVNLSNNIYQEQDPIEMPSTAPSCVIDRSHLVNYTSSSAISDTNSMDNDSGEISILIDFLVEQVESVANNSSPIDSTTHDNLRDYLYGLFDKFICDDKSIKSKSMIQTTNLVQTYHTLLTQQSLNSAHSSDSEDRTIVQTSVREYRTETLTVANCVNDQDVWLVVDLDTNSNDTSARNLDENKCLLPLPSSTVLTDDLCPHPNDSYCSFEEIKSSTSESSQSNYYSPNSSLVDLQTMVHEFDEVANINSNHNNNNNSNLLFHEDGSSNLEHTHQQQDNEGKPSNPNNAIIEPSNLLNSSSKSEPDESVTNSSPSPMPIESSESTVPTNQERRLRREKRIQERWTKNAKNDQNNSSQNDHNLNKAFLGVEFPPIAVLRRKFSSNSPATPAPLNGSATKRKDQLNSIPNKASTNSAPTEKKHDALLTDLENQEISTKNHLDLTKFPQIIEPTSNDVSSMINNVNDVHGRCHVSSMCTETTDDREITTKNTEKFFLSSTDWQGETGQISSDTNEDSREEFIRTSLNSSPMPSLSPVSIDSLASCETNDLDGKRTSVHLPEESKEYSDERIINVEKKNNCNSELKTQASGIVLAHIESTQEVVTEREKKEKEEEQKQQTQQQLSTHESDRTLEKTESTVDPLFVEKASQQRQIQAMLDPDEDQQCYNKIELEEIPDDEELTNEFISKKVEPIDCILTDDEPKTSIPSEVQNSSKHERLRSLHGKVFDKMEYAFDDAMVPTSSTITKPPSLIQNNQSSNEDPIALRALERFEQRMNAANNAKPAIEETKPVINKGKSSWSGSATGPRKSLDNIFKSKVYTTQTSEDGSCSNLSAQTDSFIRPRRTFLDDGNVNFGATSHFFVTTPETLDSKPPECSEEQEIPMATVVENDNKPISLENSFETAIKSEQYPNSDTSMVEMSTDSTSDQAQHIEKSMPTEELSQAQDNTLDASLSNISYTEDQPSLAPYRLHLEGRRRLNTLERLRERKQSIEGSTQSNSSLVNQYSVKPEEVEDPIVRRALERFDEKNRALLQLKPTNYDDIQDPITRRALMRLETNLKRTMPTHSITANNLHEPSADTRFTNSYTLGSLQSHAEPRFDRMVDAALPPPIPNHRLSHVSSHSGLPSGISNYMSEYFNDQSPMSMDDHGISHMSVHAQPNFRPSYHSIPSSINLRQRSRSEDPLSSKELSLGQTTDLTENSIESNQQCRSADESQHEIGPEAMMLDQEPNDLPQNTENSTESELNSVHQEGMLKSHGTLRNDLDYVADHPYSTGHPLNVHQRSQYHTNETGPPSAFLPVHSIPNTYYSQQSLATNSYAPMYGSANLNQTPYADDPIVRRALERFNCQMQQSLMTMSQHQPSQPPPLSNVHYPPRSYGNGHHRLNNIDSFYGNDMNGTGETWTNSYHSMPRGSHLTNASNGTSSTGYQSIIGRRRQMRYDDGYFDTTSVGNGYSSSLFINAPNNHQPMPNHFMGMSDEPPLMVTPRFTRDPYGEQVDYICENLNNNNNSNNPMQHQGYMNPPHGNAYPPNGHGFRTINQAYPSADVYQQYQDEDYLRHRAQSTSSTTSSESVNPIRLLHQRMPTTTTRTALMANKNFSAEQCQIPPGQSPSNFGNGQGDSVFHRLAYTNTKSSLSKSSSNLCANLMNKTPLNSTPTSNLKAHEIDLDEGTNPSPIENNQESINSSSNNASNKTLRSRSVDARARLKNAQTRLIQAPSRTNNDYDDQASSTSIPSSKFTSVMTRRETQPIPPRLPVTPRSTAVDRNSAAKRPPNVPNTNYNRTSSTARMRNPNGNSIDSDNLSTNEIDNDENSGTNEKLQPKIVENRTKTSIPPNRHHGGSSSNGTAHLQSSASTSSISSSLTRTKLPSSASAHLEGRENNSSTGDLNRTYRRSDEHRLLSPGVQRRTIPVSVFAPAKPEAKRPAPAPPKSTSPVENFTRPSADESTNNVSSCTDEISQPTSIPQDEEINMKLSSMPSTLKSSTGNLLKELSIANDKNDPNSMNKKMNVFERLFRGHKKKI